MSSVVRLAGVTKRYGRQPPVLRSIDLAAAPGQILGIVGANGSGKSTLLRLLAGLSRPSDGRVIGSPTVGYLPDRFPAAQRLSGRAYLRHMARIGGLTDLSGVERLVERLDLVGGPDTPMRRLSKGNAQKIGLAQAVLGDPQLLVLDEPWSGLDVAAHGVLDELITQTRARGAAVVFADHRRDLVARVADRVVEAADGTLREVELPGRTPGVDEAGRVATGPIRIELAGGDVAGLASVAGVIRVERDGGVTVLAVAPAHSDAVLAIALDRGCSVRGVRQW
ncbi:ATP-binding cassette domain-containing protein [Nakamurella lactea]|uniref:ATP-binding cassette domain-containing protein n=1 Tax=Nakamurella lactea TaxID=459515 RepID=UPI0004004B97|nr:ABC transporter ATP-binding protein [Nakamurella lactea]